MNILEHVGCKQQDSAHESHPTKEREPRPIKYGPFIDGPQTQGSLALS